MMRAAKVPLKAISLVTLFCFATSQIGWSAPSVGTGVSMPGHEVSPLTAASLGIPAELGSVTDSVIGDPAAPAFIHIQSAHGNYQAEKNIEKLLGYIEKNSSVKLMLLEGAASELQPELFRIFPQHPDFNRKVTDKLMQEGFLTGPENYLINQNSATRNAQRATSGKNALSVERSPLSAYGIEDLASYKKDREAFIKVVKREKTAEKFLGSLRSTIDKRFSSKLNKDLLNLVRQEETFGSGTLSFEGWLKALQGGSQKHLQLDLSDAFYQDQYPFLIRYYRLQAISSKIDQAKAEVEKTAFLKELEKRGIAKDVMGLFNDKDSATRNAQRTTEMKDGSTTNPNALSVDRRTLTATNGYSPLRNAFDQAFSTLPKDFSMKAWPNWTLYAQHLILMQEMEGKGLQEETVRLKDQIENALAKTAEEKEYLAQARQLYLLRRLFVLELTRSEYEELLLAQRSTVNAQRNNSNEVVARCALRVEPAILPLFEAAMSFYSTAVVREEHLFQNALKRMDLQKQQRAVIVTGGFHTEGLKKLAQEKNASYIQISPRISEVTKRDHRVYLRSIVGSRGLETSQIPEYLGITPPAESLSVTGPEFAKERRSEIRGIIEPMIDSEGPARSDLKSEFAASSLGKAAMTPDSARSEIRSEPQWQSNPLMNNPDFLNEVLFAVIQYLELGAIDKNILKTNIVKETAGRLTMETRRLDDLYGKNQGNKPVAIIRGEQSAARGFELRLKKTEQVRLHEPRIFQLPGTDYAIEVVPQTREGVTPVGAKTDFIFGTGQRAVYEQIKLITVLNYLTQEGKQNLFAKYLHLIDIKYYDVLRAVRALYRNEDKAGLNDQILLGDKESNSFDAFKKKIETVLQDQNVIPKDATQFIERLWNEIQGFLDLNDLAIELLNLALKRETISKEDAKILLFLQQVGVGLVSEEVALDINRNTRYSSLGGFDYGFQFNPSRAKRGGSFTPGMVGRLPESVLSYSYIKDFYPLQRWIETRSPGGIFFREWANPFPHRKGSVNGVLDRAEPQAVTFETLESRLNGLRTNTPQGEGTRYRDFINPPFAGQSFNHLHWQGFLGETNLEKAFLQEGALREVAVNAEGVRYLVPDEKFFRNKAKFPSHSTLVIEGRSAFEVAAAAVNVLRKTNDDGTLLITPESHFTYNVLLSDDGEMFRVFVIVRPLVKNPFDLGGASLKEPNTVVFSNDPQHAAEVAKLKTATVGVQDQASELQIQWEANPSKTADEKKAVEAKLKGLESEYLKLISAGIAAGFVIFWRSEL